MTTKTPPHSIEAEQSVLGSLIMDGKSFEKIKDILKPSDFFRPIHRDIYAAIERLYYDESVIDLCTVTVFLKENDKINSDLNNVYIAELPITTPSALNIKAYADIVRERSILRQLIKTCDGVLEDTFGMAQNKIFRADDIKEALDIIATDSTQDDYLRYIQEDIVPLLVKMNDKINKLAEGK